LAVPDLASLGVDGLENLLKVAADVAAGTGKDLDSIAGAFTKVAGDGETALSKLLRQGIVFTDEQKKVYESLIESNDELGAQAFLIETLGDKYEGAAEAVANPFDQLAEIFKNFQETVGAQLLPVLEDLVPQIQAFFDELASDPEFIKFLEDMVDEFVKMAPELKDLVPKMLDLAKVAIPAMITLLPQLVDIVTLFNEALGEGEFSLDEFKGFLEAIYTPLSILIGILGIVIEVVKEVWDRLARADILTKIINPIANARGAFDALADSIQFVIDAWNNLWGTQQNRPLRSVGSADSLERQLTPPPRYSDDMRRPLTYNISVNAIAPTAEVGRAVVDSLQAYERIGGRIA
jgi:phage-related protein